MKKLKENKGITLVALVVTIIVLLILAGVALSSVLSQDGIFSRAEQAVDKHGEAKARETLELALGEAQMQKYEQGLTDEQLTEKINAIGEELPKEKPEHPELQNVIVDGHIFEIDRSVPKIVDYVGPANGVIITASVTQNGDWENPVATVTGTIKTYSGGNITSVSATKGETPISDFSINENGRYEINNITEDIVIKITAHDSNEKEAEKTINVAVIKDITPPTIKTLNIKAEKRKIKIDATAEDNESGLKKFIYSITPETGLTKTSGEFKQGEPVELTSTTDTKYTVNILAEDNAGNKSEPQSKNIETRSAGVLKHIKTPTGLKEVNTLDIYGATVTGYDCARDDAQWQIFYIDEEDDHRVYLIAKDFMAPPINNTTSILISAGISDYKKAYKFNTEKLEDYANEIPTNAFTNKFLSEWKGTTASTKTLQATNYMLNQNIWAEYNGAKADFAFGGPTFPLFQASYNDNCDPYYEIYLRKNSIGYQIKSRQYSWTDGLGGFVEPSTQKGLYFPGAYENGAYGMWLASPSSFREDCIAYVNCSGDIETNATTDNTSYGFRPIVSLKTEVLFTANEDGTYTIVN